MAEELGLDLVPISHVFPQRVSRSSAKKNSWNQISDFFQNSYIPEVSDVLLIEAMEECAEWKRYTEQDVDDIEILYERFDGKGKVLSTLSDEDERAIHEEALNFQLDGKLWVLSGLYHTPITDKRKDFQFPLPQGRGLKVMNAVKDFKLPWNIYCPTVEGERNLVKWKHGLKRNQWMIENPFAEKRQVYSICHCKGSRCGSLCLNRSIQVECSPLNCIFGERDCGNRAFSDLMNDYRDHKKYALGLEVIKTEKKGCGLFSVRPYNIGSLIVEYTGEVINLDEVGNRLNSIYKYSDSYYFLGLEESYVIDAGQRGSIARFANHSCTPNAEMQKWLVNGEPRIGLFAKRLIEAGEEICYDYNFEWFENSEPQKCFCESKNCRAFIGKGPENVADDSSDDNANVNDKRGNQISNPVKSTTIYTSDSDFDSKLDDFDQQGFVEALESFHNHSASDNDDDVDNGDGEDEDFDDGHTPSAPKSNQPAHRPKHVTGVKLKEVMVGDDEGLDETGKSLNQVEANTIETSDSLHNLESLAKAATDIKDRWSAVRTTLPEKSDTPPVEDKPKLEDKTDSESVVESSPKSVKKESPKQNGVPEYEATRTRRSVISAFADNLDIPESLRKSLAINMAPPGRRTSPSKAGEDSPPALAKPYIKEGIVESTAGKKPVKNPAKEAPVKQSQKVKSLKSLPPKGSPSKKRKITSSKQTKSKRRKLIIDDSESDDNQSASSKNDKVLTSDSKADDPVDGVETEKILSEASSLDEPPAFIKTESGSGVSAGSFRTPETQSVKKKQSIFAKKKKSASSKSSSGIHKVTEAPKTNTPATASVSDFFNLKKSKRRYPVQTTETFSSSPHSSSSAPHQPSDGELVVHNEAQTEHEAYDQRYDWNQQQHYYDQSHYYYQDYYYNGHYYPSPPQHLQGHAAQAAERAHDEPYPPPATRASGVSIPPSRQPPYYHQPYGYPPHAPVPYPPQGNSYYPPPSRGYGYPPPPNYGYPPPPPPQPYGPVPPQAGGYNYNNPYYPPEVFTADAENELLVGSPESFADEVLQQPEDKKIEEKVEEHVSEKAVIEDRPKPITASTRGVPVDPRRRKRIGA